MARKIAVSTLNASTIDILNTIRANASYEYQSLVPEVQTEHDIPAVGDILYGYPALANQFINALVNRIALVRVKSATFNNPYRMFKKGYLEFGETIEEVFVNIAKAVEFSAEKAHARELKRTLPDVRSAFHVMNWRVMYPVTIQDEDLRMAFTSLNGVQDLISKIVDSVYKAAEYDEFLLFKYLLIKAITKGKMYPVAFDATNRTDGAIEFRTASNMLTFMSNDYNSAGVKTVTPRDEQIIFMDARYNAQFDVEVLASAFNMEKADFMGRLYLIDKWDSFDNERFDIIRANSDQIEEVTSAELALMANVKAVIVDEEWFQVYDNNNKFTEDYVGSGLYWNYWYHTWKTVSSSPFSNALVFVDDSATITTPATLTLTILSADRDNLGNITATFSADADDTLAPNNIRFVQSEMLTQNGIAIHPYGAVIIPASLVAENPAGEYDIYATLNGDTYKATFTVDDKDHKDSDSETLAAVALIPGHTTTMSKQA